MWNSICIGTMYNASNLLKMIVSKQTSLYKWNKIKKSPRTMSFYIAISSLWTHINACTLRQRHLKCCLAKRQPHGQFCKVNSLLFHTSLKNDEMAGTSCDSNLLHFSAFWTGWRARRACDGQDDTAPGWSRWWWDIILVWLMFVCSSLSASLSR